MLIAMSGGESTLGGGRATAARGEYRLGAILVALGAAFYLSWWWNRCLSPIAGHEILFANQATHVRLPYRDYFFVAPPGVVLWPILVSKLFGQAVIALWAVGGALRVVSLLCLYCWLVRVYRPATATLAVLTTTAVSAGDIADYPACYFVPQMAAMMVGCYCASRTLTASGSWQQWGWAIASGAFLGLTFLVKQTTGGIVTASVMGFFAWAGWRQESVARGWRYVLGLAVGLALALGAVGLWLLANGCLWDCIHQTMLWGPASKGGLWQSLLRPVFQTVEGGLLAEALIALTIVAILYLIQMRSRTQSTFGPSVYVAVAALIGVRLGWLGADRGFSSRLVTQAAVYVGVFGSLALGAAQARRLLQGPVDARGLQKGLLFLVAFTSAYSLAMSWPAYEVMTLPTLAIVLCEALELDYPARRRAAVHTAILGTCVLLIAVATYRKETTPTSWGFWSEPPISAGTVVAKTPQLAGFRLSPSTAEFFDEVTELIRSHAGEDEAIFTYPVWHIFYALADRKPATFAFMHFWDVCPDDLAIRDAERILEHPPAVIVASELPEDEYRSAELAFRAGKPSGQRQLAAAIARLTADYDLLQTYTSSGNHYPIKVWARKKP